MTVKGFLHSYRLHGTRSKCQVLFIPFGISTDQPLAESGEIPLLSLLLPTCHSCAPPCHSCPSPLSFLRKQESKAGI